MESSKNNKLNEKNEYISVNIITAERLIHASLLDALSVPGRGPFQIFTKEGRLALIILHRPYLGSEDNPKF